jgi:hypothetical protein
MIQRIASILTNSFAMTRACIEHKNSGRRGVGGKYAKHRLLIFVPEMKEAVPSQYPVKSSTKGERSSFPSSTWSSYSMRPVN